MGRRAFVSKNVADEHPGLTRVCLVWDQTDVADECGGGFVVDLPPGKPGGSFGVTSFGAEGRNG